MRWDDAKENHGTALCWISNEENGRTKRKLLNSVTWNNIQVSAITITGYKDKKKDGTQRIGSKKVLARKYLEIN